MQMPEIFETILNLILTKTYLVAAFVIVVFALVIVWYTRKSKSSSGVPVVKQMHRMVAQIDKGKDITEPAVRSRQELITLKFNSQMKAIGLEPENESGYVSVSYTPLARFLKERGVQDDTVSAILAGLMEEENETDVRAIITAASETPGVDLTGAELAKAQDLAVSEWTNVRRSRSV